MNKFSEEDLIKLHDCLKEVSITNYRVDDYHIESIKEAMNKLKLNTEEKLATYIFMTHDSLLSLIGEED